MNLQTHACPCCGNSLLRHARQGKVYWFCTSCRQEVPLFAVSCISRVDTALEKTATREIPVKV